MLHEKQFSHPLKDVHIFHFFLPQKEIHDLDLTTNMPLSLLSEHFTIKDNGSDYESVTIVMENYSFEITHFRRDIEYTDHRHPKVELVDNTYVAIDQVSAEEEKTGCLETVFRDGKLYKDYSLSDIRKRIDSTL